MSFSEFYRCGNRGESQILRYGPPDLTHSGVTTTYQGGLLTARHVVQNQAIPGFTCHTHPEMDIAYKADGAVKGLPLGWVDVYGLNAELVTTSIEEPDTVVSILGRLGITLMPTDLQPFTPRDYQQAAQYLKPGVSGSSLIHREHIIGVVPFWTARASADGELTAGQPMAVVFNGEYMRSRMIDFGLNLPEEPLISLSR